MPTHNDTSKFLQHITCISSGQWQ